jgi:hypothetical protein
MKKNTQKNKYEGGQVMMVTTLFLLAGSMVIVGALMTLVKSQIRVMNELSFSKSTFLFTEGALEDVVYRHRNAMNISLSETLSEGNISVTTVTTPIVGGKEVLATGNEQGRIRKIKTVLVEGDGVSFSFGVQTDNGGMVLKNNSSVDGNIYSNGSIIGSGLNLVKGTAISAGPTGYVTEVHTTGSVYAHEIEDSYIEKNAFYTSIDIATIVDGTKNPGFPDITPSSLPISDTLLDDWEAFAETKEVMTAECIAAGGHIVIDADITLGPAKIPCDVTFEKFPEVTIAGVLWITGDVTFTQGPEFRIHTDVGNKSIPIIVDDPSDRITSSRISINNSGSWIGNGNHSYIMLLSRNNSAELGGSEKAINIKNSSGGDVLVYAGHGEILLQNHSDLTGITAYRVRLQNNTEVVYDTGIASAIFIVNPNKGYVITSWQEVE